MDAAVELGGKVVVERLLTEETTVELVEIISEERLLVVAVEEVVMVGNEDNDDEEVIKDEVELDEEVLVVLVAEDDWGELIVELVEDTTEGELSVLEVSSLLGLDVVVELAGRDCVVVLLDDNWLLVLDDNAVDDWLPLLEYVVVDRLLELDKELLVLEDVETILEPVEEEPLLVKEEELVVGLVEEIKEEKVLGEEVTVDKVTFELVLGNVLELVSAEEGDRCRIFEESGVDDTFDRFTDGEKLANVRGVVYPASTKKLWRTERRTHTVFGPVDEGACNGDSA